MPYPIKKKELGENDLQRSTQDDVAVYKKPSNPTPGVYRGKSAQTIVPRDSEMDSEIGSQDKMAGEPIQNYADGGFVDQEQIKKQKGNVPDMQNLIAMQSGQPSMQDIARMRLLQNPPAQSQPMPIDERQMAILQEQGLRGYAQGGFVEPDEPELMGDLTPGTSQQQEAPPQFPPTPPPQMPPQTPPMSSGAPMAPANVPRGTLPGMPPSVTPDELQGYLSKQKQSLGKYGPDQQMALENQTLANRNSLGNRLTSGAKGFADALMMGVARAGNPGFQQQFETQQDERAREQLGAMQKAGEGQMAQTEAGMKLDMIDPKSGISESYRQSFGPIFSKMGYSPKDVAKMSASQISTVADLGVRFGDAQLQMQLKEAMLGVETIKAQSEMKNQQSQRKEAIEKMGAEHPIQRMMGMLPKPTPTPEEGFNHDAIQKGQTYRAPDGSLRVKR